VKTRSFAEFLVEFFLENICKVPSEFRMTQISFVPSLVING
jgi:hypothetical protein